MKKYQIILIICTIAFPLSQKVTAQEKTDSTTFTLEKVWNIAESQNRQLRLADLSRIEKNISILEAKDNRLPDLSVAGNYALNSKMLIYNNGLFSSPQDVPVSKYGYNFGYNLGFNIYSGGKDKRNIKIKQEEKLRSQNEFDLQRDNVKYAIAIAYYDLYKFDQFQALISNEISTEKKQLRIIETLNKNGIVLKSDVIRTSVKLSQLELSFSDVKKKIALTKQRLNLFMGRDSEDPLHIYYQETVSSNDIKNSSYEDYVAVALNKSPEYKIAYNDIKLSDLNIKQVKASLLPKVSLYSYYNYTYPQISFYPYSNDLWGYGQTGIKMMFSLDNLYKSKHSLAHASNLKDQERERASIKKDEIILKIKEAYLQREQALESVVTAEENIKQSSETVRVIRNSYLNQESLLTDLLDAENVLLDAKLTLTTAKVALRLSHIRLSVITGIL
jgi:outer membrane protein